MSSAQILIVTDFDETLAHRGAVHPLAAAAVHKFRRTGIDVLVATGRRRISADRALRSTGLHLPIVSVNGAAGHHVGSSCFHLQGFNSEDAARIVAAYADHNQSPLCLLGDDIGSVVSETRATFWYDWNDSDPSIRVINSFAGTTWADNEILAVTSRCDDHSVAESIAAALQPFAETVVSPGLNEGWFIDATAPGVTKLLAVDAWIADQYGSNRPTVIACGDARNDLALLRGADLSVVVSDSEADCLIDADAAIGAPHHGGWSDLEHIIRAFRRNLRS